MTLYLAALGAFAPFSTDIYLASMPTIQQVFSTTAANVQLTLSLFFISFAIMQLVWGPLSDRIGRKPVTIIGLAIYIIGSLFCAFSHNISMLLIARIIQAAGACTGTVMSIAIIKDTYTDHKEMTKVLGIVMSIMVIAPVIAPIIGSYLLVSFNWEANFYFLAIYGALLMCGIPFLKESHPKSIRKFLPASKLIHAYQVQLFNFPFILAVFALATNFGILFAFISASPFIYIKIYHLSPHMFGYYYAFNAAAIIIGSFIMRRINHIFTSQKIIFAMIILVFIAAISMLVATLFNHTSIWCVVVPAFIMTLSFGFAFPELTAHALKNVVEFTGIASSLLGSIRFILAGIIGFIMGLIIKGSAIPLPIVGIALNSITLGCMATYFRIYKNKIPTS
jgi:DHA1 family bicyclomycin/chloramphenicol resistance-like MFS transporter